MSRTLLFAVTASTVAGAIAAVGLVDPPVNLQASSPGTQQAGHINVAGTVLAGNVSATNASVSARSVSGTATSSTGVTSGGFFQSNSTNGRAVQGIATSTTGFSFGGYFSSPSSNGQGVFGDSLATTGASIGVHGRTDSSAGRAVYGEATAPSGQTFGGRFDNYSTAGRGVLGFASTPTGQTFGGFFQSSSSSGRGAYGTATSATGTTYGVYGKAISPSGYGVFSEGNMAATGVISGNGSGLSGVNASHLGGQPASAFLTAIPNPLVLEGNGSYIIGVKNFHATGYGLFGHTQGSNGAGVTGYADNSNSESFGVRGIAQSPIGIGVNGINQAGSGSNFGGYFESRSPDGQGLHSVNISTIGSNNYGIVGETLNTATGWAIYGLGRMGCTGTKPFRIDHPFDPQNKYLLHYSCESPDVLNVYTGNIVTDGQGFATVHLPDYYAEINKNPRYTLTVIDASEDFVLVKVVKEIQDNRFVIRTNKGTVKVSWRVDALRNDRWVQQYGAPVEVEKEGAERGKYQHPELYGAAPESGVSYHPSNPRADVSIKSPPKSR